MTQLQRATNLLKFHPVNKMATAAAVTPKKEHVDYGDVTHKAIRDPVHKSMKFSELLMAIIDTSEFQRLRDIKQLGGTYLVYPGAIHTRFDHSLGTAYLCGTLLNALRESDKYGRINEKMIQCVQIAGLCHNLGQGPFSSVYEHQYVQRLKKAKWDQTDSAFKIFKLILEKTKVKDLFKKYKIDEEDIEFIKHAMAGKTPRSPTRDKFLYEIAINRRTGIDCHTFDTISRDSFFSGIRIDFDYTRFILSASICKVENEYRLCFRQKEDFELGLLYHSLWTLQNRVYKHKTTTMIEIMLAEALQEASVVFPEIDQAIEDPKALLRLNDYIIQKITDTDDAKLTKAREIITRIKERKLYPFCGQTTPKPYIKDEVTKKNIRENITNALTSSSASSPLRDTVVQESDFLIDMVDIDVVESMQKPDYVNKYGKLVAQKYSPEKGNSVSEDKGFPYSLTNQFIRVYARVDSKKDAILARFHDWCASNKYPVSVDREKVAVEHEDSTHDDLPSPTSPASSLASLTSSPSAPAPSQVKRQLFS